MALDHVDTCEVVNLAKNDGGGSGHASRALVKNEAFEAIVMELTAGKQIPAHSVEGPIIVQCLDGEVDFSVEGQPHVMKAGDWMHLPGGASHALDAHQDTRLLVTILFPK